MLGAFEWIYPALIINVSVEKRNKCNDKHVSFIIVVDFPRNRQDNESRLNLASFYVVMNALQIHP